MLAAIGRTVLIFGALTSQASVQAMPASLQQNVVFDFTSPLSGNSELIRRTLSPLAAAQIERAFARAGQAPDGQPIDLQHEVFAVYVPPQAPPGGYALLVFVPPWNEAVLPQGWADVLDRYGTIFVSAARSGNDANTVGRREPLALLAEQNIARRYPVDPQRIYVSGFSGGARIALRLALAYPDIFRGALLNAGSDPLGQGSPPIPPRELFLRFQENSRIVSVTGEDDSDVLALDRKNLRSFQEWCMFNTDARVSRGVGHHVMDGVALSRGLEALFDRTPLDSANLASCQSRMEAELAAGLHGVEALLAGGRREEAKGLLVEIDSRFGGLAAPLSTELQSQIDAAPK